MGEVVCTLLYGSNEKRDLVFPDNVPVHHLVNSIAAGLGLPAGKNLFYDLLIDQQNEQVRIPGTRTLCQVGVLNGMILKLDLEKREAGTTAVLVFGNGTIFRLVENSIIGRLTSNNYVDVDLSTHDGNKVVSRKHAIISHVSQSYMIKDTRSHNGTFVNEQKVKEGQFVSLHPGDEICIGSLEKGVRLKFDIQ